MAVSDSVEVTSNEKPTFKIDNVLENPDGWGPLGSLEQFRDLPYQPFSKSDRLGRISDWTGMMTIERRNMNKFVPQFGIGSSRYAYYHDQDESSFQLVDTAKTTKPAYQSRNRFNQQRLNRGNIRGGSMVGGRWQPNVAMQSTVGLSKAQKNKERERQRQVRLWQQQQKGKQQNAARFAGQMVQRECSVTVRPEWVVIEEMNRSQLSKLALPTVAEPTDLYTCGAMCFYDKQYDRLNVKNERSLRRIDRVLHFVTTSDDPVIQKLSRSEADANVFATDSILATLMCCNRAQYSWDIVVTKICGKIFLDKRDNTEFDLLTVNETSTEPMPDESILAPYNTASRLALEATFISHNFSQQVLHQASDQGPGVYKFDHSNPFVDDDGGQGDDDEENEGGDGSGGRPKLAYVGYRYRKWNLGNNIMLIARTEHDAVLQSGSETQFINIKALNEWDPKLAGCVSWREQLGHQRGAVIASELKNNGCKLSKWTVQAILAGSDMLKFGFVSRFNFKDPDRHVILGTQHFKPAEFASQINLSMSNAWGILRCIVELVMKQPDGKYLIVKDPMKPVIRLYDIPNKTFDTDDSDADEDDVEVEKDEDAETESDHDPASESNEAK